MVLTCGTCGHKGEDGKDYAHDCYWVFVERGRLARSKATDAESQPDVVAVDPVAEAQSSGLRADPDLPSSASVVLPSASQPVEETPTREWLLKRVAFYAKECERQGEIIERYQRDFPQPVEREAIRAEMERIIGEMRNEGARYKSHDLGFVDSVASYRVDTWADELEALLSSSQAIRHPLYGL